MPNFVREPFVRYETRIKALTMSFESGTNLDVTATLRSGRANYVLFQRLIAGFTGLTDGNEGGTSDLVDDSGAGYEVKAYRDEQAWPARRWDSIHTAASSTFGPNNLGPVVSKLLKGGDYAEALSTCRRTGYDKNKYYIYSNTQAFSASSTFAFFIVPTSVLLTLLSPTDPRLISRAKLLNSVARTEIIG